jgi:hypothetical protein
MKMNQPLNWTDDTQHAFNKTKLLMTADVLSTFPDCNKHFNVYTDSQDYQMGACIMQDGQPVAYYSKKL